MTREQGRGRRLPRSPMSDDRDAQDRVFTAEEIAALRQAMDLLLEEFEAQVGDRVRPLRRARDGAGRSGNQGHSSLRVPPVYVLPPPPASCVDPWGYLAPCGAPIPVPVW